MMTKTAKALRAYDRFNEELPPDIAKLSVKQIEQIDEKQEELRKAVAIAFSEESPNSLDRCLELIYPGPPVAPVGGQLSFVRQMVEMSKTSDMRWNSRLVEYARVRGYKDPAKLLDDDPKAMLEFRFWIPRKWQEWYKSIGVGDLPLGKQRFYQDHEAFDKWLSRQRS